VGVYRLSVSCVKCVWPLDSQHSNAYAECVRQGQPQDPSPAQVAQIKSRQGLELLEPPRLVAVYDGRLEVAFRLPLYGVSLLEIGPARAP